MNNIKEHIRIIQVSMEKEIDSYFSKSEKEHLRFLIKLTVEFLDYLKHGNPALRSKVIAERLQYFIKGDVQPLIKLNELRYCGESIFSGIESFCIVSAAYRVLVGATNSKVELSMASLKEQFISMFHEFDMETDFKIKCRILLDLFKIQIVFAGAFYD